MNILKPEVLKKGDKIGVISPASKPGDEHVFQKGIEYLEGLDYQVVSGKNVLKERGYLAGEDVERLLDVNVMFSDPEIKAIICSRGGYGTPRILHQINYELIKKNPKIFVGYSDVTALNFAIFARSNLVTFSGPMVAVEMGRGIHSFSEKSLWESLTKTSDVIQLQNPENEKIKILKEGKAEGRLFPGCISVLVGLIGSHYMPDLTGAILVIEDIGEVPYRIDRCMAQLRLSGILEKISGLVLGQFIDCVPAEDSGPSLTHEEVIWDYVKDLNIPIIANFAYGHGPIKVTLPTGVRANLDTSDGFIRILERPVELYHV